MKYEMFVSWQCCHIILFQMINHRRKFWCLNDFGFGKKLFLFFLSFTIKIIGNRYYKTDSHIYYHYIHLMILYLFLTIILPYVLTDGILQDHDESGETLDISMKLDEATLIPCFIPRNRQSIIRYSSLKTRL